MDRQVGVYRATVVGCHEYGCFGVAMEPHKKILSVCKIILQPLE
jgi:hypothetical protein